MSIAVSAAPSNGIFNLIKLPDPTKASHQLAHLDFCGKPLAKSPIFARLKLQEAFGESNKVNAHIAPHQKFKPYTAGYLTRHNGSSNHETEAFATSRAGIRTQPS